jgi:glucose-1-phosphate adenylyltransferase
VKDGELYYSAFQVLAATQRPAMEGKRWFQGTADAVRQFD